MKVNPKKQSGFSAILVVILMVVLAALVLGGIYYYSQVYQPQSYAKNIISLYDNLEKDIQASQNKTLKDKKDYSGAIQVLEEQQAFLQKTKDKVDSIKSPKSMQVFHKDFQKALGLFISASSDAQKVAGFIIKANKLNDILKRQDEPKTVGEFVKFWEGRLPQAKTLAQDLFREEPSAVQELQFDKLKSTWQEAEEGYDIVLAFLKKQDPNILTSSVSEESLSKDEREKIKKISDFLSMLEDIAGSDAESLIKFSTLETLAGDELKQLAPNISNGIRELKEKYQK